jgi:hypothetical protein
VAELARVEQVAKEKAAMPGGGAQAGGGGASATPGNLFNIESQPFEVRLNASGPAWAITNARIVPVNGPVIEKGSIVIRGNKIAAVGAGVPLPSGGKIIDAKGASVYPGFIDGATDLGINEPGVRNYEDVSEMLPFNQMLRTRTAYQSDSDAVPIARVEGVTSAAIFMGGGTLAGDVPLMNLDGWTWEENTVRAATGLAMTFPGGGGGGRGGRGGGAPAPGNVQQELDKLMQQAKAYGANPKRTVDWNLEPLVPIITKQQPMFIQAGSDAAIRDAIAWAERQGINIVIRTSPGSAVASAALLKTKNVPVILSDVLSMPQGEDLFHAANYQAAGELSKAGVLFAFSSGGYDGARLIPFQAAMSVAWGLNRDEAIKALTINAAKIFGADKVIGSLEPGKLANLVIVSGDPLEIRSRIQHVVIAGRDIPLDSKHVDLFKRYMGRQ